MPFQMDTEKRFQAILEAVPDGIVIINQDGKINFINTQTEKLFGYTKAELIGQYVEILIPQPYRDRHPQHRDNFFKNPHPRSMGIGMELFGQRKNLAIFPVEISLSPLQTQEGMIVLATVRDITERKKIDKMKNEFLSIVSHELKTPLTAIQGAIDLIEGMDQEELSREEIKKLLTIAKQNSKRLSQLIADILNIEKIESGKAEFELQPISINALAKEAVISNQSYASQFNVKIVLESSIPDVVINADSNKLLQVFDNLISNAIKFSGHGKVVTINFVKRKQRVRVMIRDEGIGIPTEFRSHIFEKFMQADASSSRKHGGTGLGLSISKAIIEQHGGIINFKTVLGKGSTFYFELPIAKIKNGIKK